MGLSAAFHIFFHDKRKTVENQFFLRGSAQIDNKRPIVKKRNYCSQKLRRGEGRHARETLRYKDHLFSNGEKTKMRCLIPSTGYCLALSLADDVDIWFWIEKLDSKVPRVLLVAY